MSVRIASKCAVCGRELCIVADQELRWRSEAADVRPLVFEPSVDWSRLRARTIIDDY